MTFVSETEEFSLLGGPLHRLGARLGLVRGGTNTVALGLALGWVPWLFLVLLALAEGGATKIFTLPVVGVHARLLLAVPLLFVAETALDAEVPGIRYAAGPLGGRGTARFARTGGRCRASPALGGTPGCRTQRASSPRLRCRCSGRGYVFPGRARMKRARSSPPCPLPRRGIGSSVYRSFVS